MTLKLEAGKSYMTVDGRCSGAMWFDGVVFRAPNIRTRSGYDKWYRIDGSVVRPSPGEENDRLIAEWSEPAVPPMFKDLPREQQIAMMDAMMRGELERYWKDGNEAGWDRVWEICPSHQYRISTRLPSVNWDHVHNSVNFITVDGPLRDGRGWRQKPIYKNGRWSGDGFWYVRCIASFDPGTCPAEQAIIIRSGYVEETK